MNRMRNTIHKIDPNCNSGTKNVMNEMKNYTKRFKEILIEQKNL